MTSSHKDASCSDRGPPPPINATHPTRGASARASSSVSVTVLAQKSPVIWVDSDSDGDAPSTLDDVGLQRNEEHSSGVETLRESLQSKRHAAAETNAITGSINKCIIPPASITDGCDGRDVRQELSNHIRHEELGSRITHATSHRLLPNTRPRITHVSGNAKGRYYAVIIG
ncbi:hypothetical protein HYPSUDRAFT_206705 [Hypholoma sublateritium FD-334 SS-4]|uniref:Uncharacterized protein n=1 Tax=Hypholoma sublateritium (strain FD-334 SS-4) TaxID=945553 RepID=A0A0D2M0Q9_HYPSF|nr:hypothetical protein HYPSUDRAFT_206705 [Hypholoma sublateritium FD-334 SS-4]